MEPVRSNWSGGIRPGVVRPGRNALATVGACTRPAGAGSDGRIQVKPPLFVQPHERRAARTIRSRHRLGTVWAVGGLLVATVAGTGAAARADTPAGPRPAAQAASAGPGCSLPSGSEFASCVRVQASLAKFPAVGETVDVRIEVLAQFTRDDVQVQVDLPENLSWESLPKGMREVSGAKAYGQVLHRADGSVTLSADRPVLLTGRVRATSAGQAQIRARVAAGDVLGETAETVVSTTIAAAGAAPAAAAPAPCARPPGRPLRGWHRRRPDWAGRHSGSPRSRRTRPRNGRRGPRDPRTAVRGRGGPASRAAGSTSTGTATRTRA